jgi:YfiH family protein
MGVADGNVGFSAPRDKADAWAMRQQWCAAAGMDPHTLVTLGQVHGADVHIVRDQHAGWGATPGSTQIGLGDALITDAWGPVLMTLHADCQPLLFVDPGNGARGPVVGVAHAGWRGTVADVAGQTIAAMTAAFGTRAEDLVVAIGPAIGPCCYAVGEEVQQAWRQRAGVDAEVALDHQVGQVSLSLREANALLLERAGVRRERIEMSTICTRCEGRNWFSHRGQGAATGRFGAMIAITNGSRH